MKELFQFICTINFILFTKLMQRSSRINIDQEIDEAVSSNIREVNLRGKRTTWKQDSREKGNYVRALHFDLSYSLLAIHTTLMFTEIFRKYRTLFGFPLIGAVND